MHEYLCINDSNYVKTRKKVKVKSRNPLHHTGNLEEAGDFLVKANIPEIDPDIRKTYRVKFPLQNLFSLLVLLSLERGQNCSAAAQRSDPAQGPHVPQPNRPVRTQCRRQLGDY